MIVDPAIGGCGMRRGSRARYRTRVSKRDGGCGRSEAKPEAAR